MIHYGLKVPDEDFQRKVGQVPVGKAASSMVIIDDLSLLRHSLLEGALLRIIPPHLKVPPNKRWRHDKRRPFPHSPEGDAHAVARLGVLDARLRHDHTASNNRCF